MQKQQTNKSNTKTNNNGGRNTSNLNDS
jgi:hypothetical protein